MAFNLRHRHFVKLLDFTPKEINFLIELAADLKKAKYAGIEQPKLKGTLPSTKIKPRKKKKKLSADEKLFKDLKAWKKRKKAKRKEKNK